MIRKVEKATSLNRSSRDMTRLNRAMLPRMRLWNETKQEDAAPCSRHPGWSRPASRRSVRALLPCFPGARPNNSRQHLSPYSFDAPTLRSALLILPVSEMHSRHHGNVTMRSRTDCHFEKKELRVILVAWRIHFSEKDLVIERPRDPCSVYDCLKTRIPPSSSKMGEIGPRKVIFLHVQPP